MQNGLTRRKDKLKVRPVLLSMSRFSLGPAKDPCCYESRLEIGGFFYVAHQLGKRLTEKLSAIRA